MQPLIRRITGIREGEGLRSVLMFSYIFLIIASLLIVKPVRNSLFITRYGASHLPYVYLLVAVVAGAVTFSYVRMIRRFRLSHVIASTLLVSILIFGLFLRLLRAQITPGWVVYAFYVWVQIFGMIATTQFWLLANYVFNSREAKRLFGFIGAGAISGGIAGGYLTRWLVPSVGTVQMIVLCAAFLSVNLVILRLVWTRSAKQRLRERKQQPQQLGDRDAGTTPLQLVLGSSYLRLMAGIVGIGVIVATLVEYQFSMIASQSIRDRDSLTGFFGFWLSNLSILSLAVQFFLTGRVLMNFGVGASLFFLPLAILGGSFGILIHPGIWTAILLKISDGGLKQSVNKAGVELLYLPLPLQVKNQVKAFIDIFVDSFAGGLGGVLLIILTIAVGTDVRSISLIVIGLICAWLALTIGMRREYVNAFRLAIDKRIIDLDAQSVNLDDAALFEYLTRILNRGSSRNILYVLHLMESSRNLKWLPHVQKLLQHYSPEVRTQAIRVLSNYVSEDSSAVVEPLVEDPDDETRVLAIQYLCRRAPDRVVKLAAYLRDDRLWIQSAAVMVAALESGVNQDFRRHFPMEETFRRMMDSAPQCPDPAANCALKATAARVIGAAATPALYPYLHVLIQDPASEVQRAAILAAGETGALEYVPVLIRTLDRPGVRASARTALAEYGEKALYSLLERMLDSNEHSSVRRRIPGVIALIGTQKSMDALTAALDQHDLFLRYEVIKSMSKLHAASPHLKIDQERITQKILLETENYYTIVSILAAESHRAGGSDPAALIRARRLLVRALEERLDHNLERIFRLLGMKYPPRDMFNAYRGIVSRREDLRANAVEFLDNVLDTGLKRDILPIAEMRQTEAMIRSVQGRFGHDVHNNGDILDGLLEGDDHWLQVCALYLLAHRKEKSAASAIARLVSSSDPTVKETAQYALRALEFPIR